MYSEAIFDADAAFQDRLPYRRAVFVAVGGCLVVALLEVANDLLMAAWGGRDRTLLQAVRTHLPWWLLWTVFMPAVLALARAFRFDDHRWPRSALVHAGLGGIIAVAHGVLFGVTYHHLTGLSPGPSLGADIRRFLTSYLFQDLMTYAATIGAYWSVEYFRHFRNSALAAAHADARASRLRARLADARLHALRMELNPHFLFNTLNAVAGLVRRREHDRAIDMLVRLGDLLRTTLQRGMPSEIPLGDELALLRQYLDIERVRFDDRLRVTWEIDAECLDALVPPLILQPVVENALRHGIARRSGVGTLCIAAQRQGLHLELTVRDSSEGSRLMMLTGPGPTPHEGIGLRNTRERLEELYGAEAVTLELRRVRGHGACALMRFPFHQGRSAPPVTMEA